MFVSVQMPIAPLSLARRSSASASASCWNGSDANQRMRPSYLRCAAKKSSLMARAAATLCARVPQYTFGAVRLIRATSTLASSMSLMRRSQSSIGGVIRPIEPPR
jgi:hypothetical protein